MSIYGLIKATSRVMRADTITDLHTINEHRIAIGLKAFVADGPSVRKLENSVAMSIEGLDSSKLPKLVRGLGFYISIRPEITDKERRKIEKLNQKP